MRHNNLRGPKLRCGICQPDGQCIRTPDAPACALTEALPAGCDCGDECVMSDGETIGECQQDGVTCAINVQPPNCGEEDRDSSNQNPDDERCGDCGEPCILPGEDTEGFCQEDETTCASGPPECDPCRFAACNMVYGKCYGDILPGECCPTEIECPTSPIGCPCGEVCYMPDGDNGVCQEDNTCALNYEPACLPEHCSRVLCPGPEPGLCYGERLPGECCPPLVDCPTLPGTCPCGEKCRTSDGEDGYCQEDGYSCDFGSPECPPEDCSRVLCPAPGPNLCFGPAEPGKCCAPIIDCPTLPESCRCGEKCLTLDEEEGYCQQDGTTCAVGIPECASVDCSRVLCQGPEPGLCLGEVPKGECCPELRDCSIKPGTCPCGQVCRTPEGQDGFCQDDNTSCDIRIPRCFPPDCSTVDCAPREEGKCYAMPPGFLCCEVEVPCPEECPCGIECKMPTGEVGVCQTDGVTCAVNVRPPDCKPDCSRVDCPPQYSRFGDKCYGGVPEGGCCPAEVECPDCTAVKCNGAPKSQDGDICYGEVPWDGCCPEVIPCKPVCGENEYYNECGSPCRDDCETIMQDPIDCIKKCESGCFCIDGFVIGPDGICIPKEECCMPPMIWDECGTSCPATCDNPNAPNGPCIEMCRTGCRCPDDMVLDENGRCIMPEECQPPE